MRRSKLDTTNSAGRQEESEREPSLGGDGTDCAHCRSTPALRAQRDVATTSWPFKLFVFLAYLQEVCQKKKFVKIKKKKEFPEENIFERLKWKGRGEGTWINAVEQK